jgi:hypothetical protein
MVNIIKKVGKELQSGYINIIIIILFVLTTMNVLKNILVNFCIIGSHGSIDI